MYTVHVIKNSHRSASTQTAQTYAYPSAHPAHPSFKVEKSMSVSVSFCELRPDTEIRWAGWLQSTVNAHAWWEPFIACALLRWPCLPRGLLKM